MALCLRKGHVRKKARISKPFYSQEQSTRKTIPLARKAQPITLASTLNNAPYSSLSFLPLALESLQQSPFRPHHRPQAPCQ